MLCLGNKRPGRGCYIPVELFLVFLLSSPFAVV